MITVVVQFDLPERITREKAQQLFLDSAPKYQKVNGLVRKYYTLAEDGMSAGGVYLFKSKKDADDLYTEEWKKYILRKYGGKPSFSYFECPVVVDNLTGMILKE